MKKFVSFLLIFSLCLPISSFAYSRNEIPPLAEGETWYPASDIATCEDANDACLLTDHLPPSGYRYIGCAKGDSTVDADRLKETLTFSAHIPGLGNISKVIELLAFGISVSDYLSYGRQLSSYTKFMWANNTGCYWFHVVWVDDFNNDGQVEYITCQVERA